MRSTTVLPLVAGALLACSACSSDDAPGTGGSGARGLFRLQLTDAPIDNPDVDDVYLTVAEVRIDGEVQPLLSERATIDISNYTGGRLVQIGVDQVLPVGPYATVEIVLDPVHSADSSGVGCYVELTDGTREPLGVAGQTEVVLTTQANFAVEEREVTSYVFDVDLRKLIDVNPDDPSDYLFAGQADLDRSITPLRPELTGTVEGALLRADGAPAPVGALVVYAYPKGEADVAGEVAAEFVHAVASTRISDAEAYRLPLLEEGEYELIVAHYEDTDLDGAIEFRGVVQADVEIDFALRGINVTANATTEANLLIGGYVD